MACGTSAVSGASGRERENLLVRARLSPEEREILDRFERRELRPVADIERELEGRLPGNSSSRSISTPVAVP